MSIIKAEKVVIESISNREKNDNSLYFISDKFSKNYLYQDKKNNVTIIRVLKKYQIIRSRMDKLIGLIDSMLFRFQKVFALRFDLHFKESTLEDTNTKLQGFLKLLKYNLRKMYNSPVKIAWSCEKAKSNKHHYHLALFMNGHHVKSEKKIMEIIRDKWKKIAGGNSPYISNADYLIKCTNSEKFWNSLQSLFVRLSYLAKSETDFRPSQTKFSFGMSHIEFK